MSPTSCARVFLDKRWVFFTPADDARRTTVCFPHLDVRFRLFVCLQSQCIAKPIQLLNFKQSPNPYRLSASNADLPPSQPRTISSRHPPTSPHILQNHSHILLLNQTMR